MPSWTLTGSYSTRGDSFAALPEQRNTDGIGDRGSTAHNRYGAAVEENVPGRVAARGDRVVEAVA
jgi:hypothetical protein